MEDVIYEVITQRLVTGDNPRRRQGIIDTPTSTHESQGSSNERFMGITLALEYYGT